MRTKKSSSMRLKFDGSKWYVEKVTVERSFDSLLRRWNISDTKTERLGLDAYNPKLCKKIEFKIIEKRTGTDNYSLETKQALFVRDLVITVPRTKRFKHIFLSLVKASPKVGGGIVPMMHDLSHGFSTKLSFRRIFSPDSPFNFKISKARRISPKNALELMKNDEAYPNILQKHGSHFVILI